MQGRRLSRVVGGVGRDRGWGSQNPQGRDSARGGCDEEGVRGWRWQCWYGFREEREGRKERDGSSEWLVHY